MTHEEDRFAQALAPIAAAGDDPRLWPEALGAIAACTDDVGAIFVYPRPDGSFGTLVTPSLETAQRDFESSEWRSRDLRFERAAERGLLGGQCVTDRHLVTEQEIENHPYYTQLLRPHGLKYFAGVNVSVAGGGGAALSVQRTADRAPFSDDELAVVACFAPALGEALGRNAAQAAQAHAFSGGDAAAPDVAALLRRLVEG